MHIFKGRGWVRWTLSALLIFAAFSLPCLPSSVPGAAEDLNCQDAEGRGGGALCAAVWPALVTITGRAIQDPVTAFTLVLALSTIGLWLQTKRLANLAAKSAEDMQKSIAVAERAAKSAEDAVTIAAYSTRAELRAYVGIESAEILPSAKIGGQQRRPFAARITLKNYGQTPARHVIFRYRAEAVGVGALGSFDRNLEDISGTSPVIMAKSQSIGVRVEAILTPEENAALRAEDAAAIVVGEIRYTDVFDNHWIEPFCLRVFNFGQTDQRIAPFGGRLLKGEGPTE